MNYLSILLVFTALLFSCEENEPEGEVNPDNGLEVILPQLDTVNEWKNGFLICWRGNAEENIRSAKALGYRYVNETCQNATKIDNYKRFSESKGMRFYLDVPEFSWVPQMPEIDAATLNDLKAQSFSPLFADYPKMSQRIKDEWLADLKDYNAEVYENIKSTYEKYYCLVDGTSAFPENLALGWVFAGGEARLMPDYQQQAVIDSIVARTIELAHERESIPNDYLFQGITMDVPSKWSEFARPPAYDETKYSDWKLDCGMSGYDLTGDSHDYDTFREGWFYFMLTMKERLSAEFPDRTIRFLLEPWQVWRDGYCGRWGYWIDSLDGMPFFSFDQKKQIAGDLIMMEGNFVNQFYDQDIVDKILGSGLITLDNMAISSPNLKERYYEEGNPETHLNYIGELAMKKGWFVSYGRFNSSQTSISERLPQLTLSRLLANWVNLTKVPVEERYWDQDNQIFDCVTGHADPSIIYGKEPRSGKYYAVWVKNDGVMKLQEGEKIISIRATNSYYEDEGTGSLNALNHFTVDGETITMNENGRLDQCYVIKVGVKK